MILTSLLVRNFRNIQETRLSLSPGIHLFIGKNAQGKTALIEAVLFLATSTSHRTRREEDLIQWGNDVAFLRGNVQNRDLTYTIECGLEKKRKLLKIDGQILPRVGDLYGHLRVVLFAPEDLNIVSGSPQERRRFIDMAIAQLEPDYIPLLQQFRRSLNQRNQLLKRLQSTPESDSRRELAVWDKTYIDLAVQVISRRCKMIQTFAPLLQNYYEALSEEGPFIMNYSAGNEVSENTIRDAIQAKLERVHQTEIERGNTLAGPHRDDLNLLLDGKHISVFGSQGQRRTAALALRLAEAKLSFEKTGIRPLLLIDDVVYEMDNSRRARFWEHVDQDSQLIVTATSREHLGPGIEPSTIYKVQNGEIYPNST